MSRSGTLVLLVALCASAFAHAQDAGPGFGDIDLKRAGLIKGNYKTGHLIESMSGGVEMTFLGKTPAEDIEIEAQTVDFSYNEVDDEPNFILMQGAVVIHLEGNVVTAGRAEFDIEADIARFTKSPMIAYADGPKLAASLILIHLESGDFEIHDGVRVREDG